ncbi:hypothetical protein QQ045_020487 [Rhodiola kirilowii]
MSVDEVVEGTEQINEKLVLTLEDEEWEKSGRAISKALVLKLISDKKYTYNGVVAFLRKAWVLKGKVKFGEAKGNKIIARFEREEDMEKVLEGGPWTYGGCAILLSRWEHRAVSSEIASNKLGIWV